MKIFIYGSGAQGRVVRSILASTDVCPEFIDDTESLWGTHIDGVLVAGGYDYLLSIKAEVQGVVVAMGDPVVRLKLGGELEKDSFSLINAIHSKSIIMDKVDLGKGNMISAGAVVVSGAELGKNIIVNTASIVEHDCVLGDGVTIGPGVSMAGRVVIEPGAFIGTGAVILPRIRIGRGSIVGAGAVVCKDVPPEVIVRGNKAEIHGAVGPDFNWKKLL